MPLLDTKKKLVFRLPGQPELERALNALSDRLHETTMAQPQISAGRNTRVVQHGNKVVVESDGEGGSPHSMRHPFRFSRATFDGDNGIYIQAGEVDDITPTIDGAGSPLSSTLSDNFLATWQDPDTAPTGAVVFEFTVDDTDEWTMTVTSILIQWYDDYTTDIPADDNSTPSARLMYKILGYDSPSAGPQNRFFTNLGLVREGQTGSPYFLYGK